MNRCNQINGIEVSEQMGFMEHRRVELVNECITDVCQVQMTVL